MRLATKAQKRRSAQKGQMRSQRGQSQRGQMTQKRRNSQKGQMRSQRGKRQGMDSDSRRSRIQEIRKRMQSRRGGDAQRRTRHQQRSL